MVREGFFCKVVMSELRQECWDATSHEGSQTSLLEKRHSKCRGTEAGRVQDVTHSLMNLVGAVAEPLICIALIFLQRSKEAFGESTGLGSYSELDSLFSSASNILRTLVKLFNLSWPQFFDL